MNTGYLILALGVLGIVAGAIVYAVVGHHTIGLGGIGLGILLVLVGIWYARSTPMKAPPEPNPA